MLTLDEVMTFKEATDKWKIGDSTLRGIVGSGRLHENIDYRKSGKIWLISKTAMIKLYGLPEN